LPENQIDYLRAGRLPKVWQDGLFDDSDLGIISGVDIGKTTEGISKMVCQLKE